MQRLRAVFAVTATFFLYAQTAPPENPVMAHYRAYRAAFEAGDLAAAETAAEAALRESVARSGQGGRTGVLALNLAQVRLTRGRIAEAHAPAQQAFEISSAADSGVDPLLARLTLGRAELTDDRFRQGRERLMPALREATDRPELHADAYNAAADLGRKLMSQSLYPNGAAAWAEAMRFSDLVQGDSTYVRAEARLGYGVAQLSNAVNQMRFIDDSDTDRTIGYDIEGGFGPPRRALVEAANIMRPLAHQQGNSLDMTPAQSMFSTAVAWRMMLDSYLMSNGRRRELYAIRGDEARAAADENTSIAVAGAPTCDVDINTEPSPDFPAQGQSFFSAGAVVVRILVDENGQTQDTRVAAAIPERWFADAVARVAPQWTITRGADSPADCRMPPVIFQSTLFYFR